MKTDGHQAVLEAKRRRLEALRAVFANHTRSGEPWVLEIGCGHGHFLTDYAAANRQQFCIGIDLISRRVEKSGRKRERQGLDNLEFHKAEVEEFLEALPDEQQFRDVFMLYPDPWPKKRHFRRRMIQPDLVAELHRRLVADGHFYFRTDHDDLFEWAVEHFQQHGGWTIELGAPWPLERSTVFEDITGRRRDFVAGKAAR